MKILITGGCGYIGSALYRHLKSAGHHVQSVDWTNQAAPDGIDNLNRNYRSLEIFDLSCDVLVHLAGHSSVAACEGDPWGSTENNLAGFLPFLRQLSFLPNPPIVLWASSGSVLSDVHSLYDEQKRALEALVPRLYPRSVGLRFASVCGVSPNQRDDLILNAMVKSAVTRGYLNVANPFISKPVLGLKDLCRRVTAMVESDGDMEWPVESISSFTCTPELSSWAVKAATGCEIRRNPSPRAYDFQMPMTHGATETLESIVADLVEHYTAKAVECRNIWPGKGYDAPPAIRIVNPAPIEPDTEDRHRV